MRDLPASSSCLREGTRGLSLHSWGGWLGSPIPPPGSPAWVPPQGPGGRPLASCPVLRCLLPSLHWGARDKGLGVPFPKPSCSRKQGQQLSINQRCLWGGGGGGPGPPPPGPGPRDGAPGGGAVSRDRPPRTESLGQGPQGGGPRSGPQVGPQEALLALLSAFIILLDNEWAKVAGSSRRRL